MERTSLTRFQNKLLRAKKVGLDSMIFLYHFADHKKYAPLTELLFTLLEEDKIQAVTSMVTISEVFVRAEEKHDSHTIDSYEAFFRNAPHLEILPIDWHIARLGSMLRASYKTLRLPDALQIAATLMHEFPLFITNDKSLSQVKEVEVVLLDQYLK